MMKRTVDLKETLQDVCADDGLQYCAEPEDMPTFMVKSENLLDLCNKLKQNPELKFNFLSDISGVDYLPRSPRFDVVYHLYSLDFNDRIRLKVQLNEGECIPSVIPIWNAANWQERELYDMLGITVSDHPDLRRIYMADDFDGHPLRKDFPVRGYKDEFNPDGEEKKDLT